MRQFSAKEVNLSVDFCSTFMQWLYRLDQNAHLFASDLSSIFFTVAVEEEGMSTVQFFFTLVFSVLGLGVLAVVGLVVYGRWKENRRKRFY